MMRDKIVPLAVRPKLVPKVNAVDIWHAQISDRLAGIERMMRRLEWQVWGLVCGAGGLLVLEILRHVQGR